jgi:hypothetical protein
MNVKIIEDKMKKRKSLRVIDLDYIRELRKVNPLKAEELRQAYLKDVKKAAKIELNNIIRKDRIIKKFYRICIESGCNKPAKKNHVFCEHHFESRKKYRNNHREYFREYYKAHKEQIREYNRKRKELNKLNQNEENN